MWAAGKHKRRINCGAWSYQNQLAYGSDDKQISVTCETGQIQDQVRLVSLPCLMWWYSSGPLFSRKLKFRMMLGFSCHARRFRRIGTCTGSSVLLGTEPPLFLSCRKVWAFLSSY